MCDSSDKSGSPSVTPSPQSIWQDSWNSALLGNYGTPKIELVAGSGARVTGADGTEYLDLLAGIAVNALGHGHPAIVEAVTQQISTLGHTSNLFAHPQVITLAERLKGILAQVVDMGVADDSTTADTIARAQVFFCNSGAEANEAAFKIARATGRSKILAAEKGFHGRTMGALALTGQPAKQAPFAPLPAGVSYYPYGDIDALRELADEDTAAIFLESIQGETGVIPAPVGFLRQVRELCDERGILMVVDEVQAGIGRTGQWFGFQSEGSFADHTADTVADAADAAAALPDVITLAKGLGGGLPIGACIAMPSAQLLASGMHGTTFGGNPVVCAAANAVLDTIESENILDNVRARGEQLAAALGVDPSVSLVRGRGLMIGVVLDQPLAVEPLDYGLILNQPSPDVLRLVPPLTLSETETAEAIETLQRMLADHRSALAADR